MRVNEHIVFFFIKSPLAFRIMQSLKKRLKQVNFYEPLSVRQLFPFIQRLHMTQTVVWLVSCLPVHRIL